MRVLARSIGAADFAAFRPHFAELRAAAFAAVPGLPGTPGFSAPLGREWAEDDEAGYPAAPALVRIGDFWGERRGVGGARPHQPPTTHAHSFFPLSFSHTPPHPNKTHPHQPYTLAGLEDRVRAMYKLVTEGKFSEGLKAADGLLAVIPLTVVANRREADEVKELVSIAREYNIGLRCELERKAATDPKRAAELAAYFTHARLQPAHAALALRAAMVQHYKAGNLACAAGFAARLLEIGALPAKIGAQARQVAAACEKDGPPTDAMGDLAYDARNPFDLCAGSFVPIYRGAAFVEDPYTGARFVPEWEGKVSPVGGIARIGAQASGLVSVREEGRRR
jgi:coatomer subunit alpha